MLDKLQNTDFLPYLNQMFRIYLDDTTYVDIELISAKEAGVAAQSEARNPFSLHFLGPVSQQYLQQHTYHFQHEKMGAFDLFMVPLGFEAGRMRYEIIFT